MAQITISATAVDLDNAIKFHGKSGYRHSARVSKVSSRKRTTEPTPRRAGAPASLRSHADYRASDAGR